MSTGHIRNPRVSASGRWLVRRHGHSGCWMSLREAWSALGFCAWSPLILMIALYCLSLLGAVALEEETSDSRCETMWLRGVQVWLWARSPGGDDALLVGRSW